MPYGYLATHTDRSSRWSLFTLIVLHADYTVQDNPVIGY